MPATHEESALYVVAYDIPCGRRRARVHRTLCGYGTWTQFSLFECWLTRRQLLELQAALARLLQPQEDSLRLYPLCRACCAKVVTIGDPPPREAVALIV